MSCPACVVCCLRRFLSLSTAGVVLSAVVLQLPGTLLRAQQAAAHLSTSLQMLPLPGYDSEVGSAYSPVGIGMDASGNLYVVDESLGTVTEVQRSGNNYFSATLLQYLTAPNGIAVDSQGNLFLTQFGQPSGIIKETSPGTPYLDPNYQPSLIPVNGLSQPAGIAIDSKGNLYVADTGNNRIVKMTLSGSTYTQSTMPTSVLSMPYSVAVDAGGDVFIGDYGHKRILKETPAAAGYTESVVDGNTQDNPLGVAVDGSGNVYVLNFVDQQTASVLQETPVNGGYVPNTVSIPSGFDPVSIAVDDQGLYLAAPGTNQLGRLVMGAPAMGDVQVTATGLAAWLVFTFDKGGSIGKPLVQTQGAAGLDFADTTAGTCDSQGTGHVYAVGDTCAVQVLFSPATAGTRFGAVTLLDNSGGVVGQGNVFGVGDASQTGFLPGESEVLDSGLAHPMGVAVDSAGGLYLVENKTGKVYKETLSAGGPSRTLVAQGLAAPTASAVDGTGSIYIAAADALYKEIPAAGGYTQSKISIGATNLAGVALDGRGNLFVVSSSSGDVLKETLAGDGTYVESQVGSGISNPSGVALDSDGNILVSDSRQGNVYKETLNADGSYTQSVIAGGLDGPAGLACVGTALVYVAASGGEAVYQYVQQKAILTEAPNGIYLQGLVFPTPTTPWGIALDNLKNLYVTSNVGDGTLNSIDIADPPTLHFPNTGQGEVSAPRTITLANVGNTTLAGGPAPTISAGFQFTSDSTCNLPDAGIIWAGNTCLFSIDFAPKTHATYQGAVTLKDTNLNADVVEQQIPLSGLGVTSDTTRTTVRAAPDPVKAGLGVTTTVTVTDTTEVANVPAGNVTATDTLGDVITMLNGGIPVSLANGKAILTMTAGAAGSHTITVHYNGVDASFAGSTGTTNLIVSP
jgi:large repetitive protein